MGNERTSRNSTHSVYEKLKLAILDRHFGPGVKLTNQGIAEQLGVSRTPVREALERLLQEGFVYRIPHRGFFVAEMGMEEVRYYYQTREALEIYQVKQLLQVGINKRNLASLRSLNARYGKLTEANLTFDRLTVDRTFHVRLAGLTGNSILANMLDSIFEKLILKRRLEGAVDPSGRQSHQDHVELLDALEIGDPRAQEILERHVRGACDRLIEHLKNFGSPTMPFR